MADEKKEIMCDGTDCLFCNCKCPECGSNDIWVYSQPDEPDDSFISLGCMNCFKEFGQDANFSEAYSKMEKLKKGFYHNIRMLHRTKEECER